MALRHALLKMQARLEFCNELKSNVAGLPNNDFLYVDIFRHPNQFLLPAYEKFVP